MSWVDSNKCKGCGACVNVCPLPAISLIKEFGLDLHAISPDKIIAKVT
ncbi:MAG: 4Fe-4S binding protein [Candidatus Omnitrophica bacterium]|nr:4Fe-4S binding protein [Candidatus Omnitrophota bacterium]